MFIGDIFQAMYVIFLSRKRARLAGFFDGLEDCCNVVSYGGGASTIYIPPSTLHITDVSCVTLLLILVGSVLGAELGNWISAKLTPPEVVVVAQSEI